MHAPTLIEFTHRLSTGLDSALLIALCVWAFWAFPAKHLTRRYSLYSLLFLFIEALLGAGLVLLRLVARDASAGRAIYLSAHLTNTLLLLAALTATAWAATGNRRRVAVASISGSILAALAVVALTGVTGAIAALGDTLFPASSLAAGLRQDFASTSHLLLRLRLFHPVIAVAGAAYLLWTAGRVANGSRDATRVLVLTVVQVAAGMVNLGLRAPLFLQLLHLLIADLLWIAAVMWALNDSGGADAGRALRETGDERFVESVVQL